MTPAPTRTVPSPTGALPPLDAGETRRRTVTALTRLARIEADPSLRNTGARWRAHEAAYPGSGAAATAESSSSGLRCDDDTYLEPLSEAQAAVVRDLWLTGRWSVLEIARYLGVSPYRVNTGQAEALVRNDAPRAEVEAAFKPTDAERQKLDELLAMPALYPWRAE